MTNLGDIFDYVNFVLNKGQKSGLITPNNFTTALKAANLELYVDARSYYEDNSALSDDARALIKTLGDSVIPTPSISNIHGVIDLPEDYQYFSSLSWLKTVSGEGCNPSRKEIGVEWLTDNQWQVRVNSKLKGGSRRFPIMTIQNNKILVSPVGSRYKLTYWKKPVSPFFDYSIVNGAVTYLPPGEVHDGSNPGVPSGTPSRSVEVEWTELKRYADKVLRVIASSKRAEDIYQKALMEMAKQQAQWTSKVS